MPADLQQNILYMVFFIITHNFFALLAACGIALFAVLSLWKPSRPKLLILFGCAILLFGIEYDKHIAKALQQQTTNSLITIQPHNKVKRAVDLSLTKALPLGLPLLGIAFIAAGVLVWKKVIRLPD